MIRVAWNRLPGEMVDVPDLEEAGKLEMDGLKDSFKPQTLSFFVFLSSAEPLLSVSVPPLPCVLYRI